MDPRTFPTSRKTAANIIAKVIAGDGRTAYAPCMSDQPTCPRCKKSAALCVCDEVPQIGTPIDNKVALLILQHPQEQDVDLGTARLAAAHFKDAAVKVGLSWPSLSKAVGRPADPKRWAVLYLGSVKGSDLAPGRDVVALNRKGTAAAPDQDSVLKNIDGVILLDGTWSQAKALWWRNAWMLKAQRVALNPRRPSRYGKLRKEPRRDGLSTLEAAALLLSRLENKPDIETALIASFEKMLARYREVRATERRASASES
jgi:DTW domain-containing protein YfiP